jgi:putative DNA primase/helicase
MRNDVERIREALRYIPVGGHDERVRVAFALKSELGDAGRDLWDEWRGERGGDEAASVWRSASDSGALRIGTVFHAAKANGWSDSGRYDGPTPDEIAERKRVAAARAASEEAEIARERADTAAKAAEILRAATQAPADHPYLNRKRISPVPTLREIDAAVAAAILGYPPKSGGEALTGRLLVVPVKQGNRISTVELIDGDKRKAALAGRGSKAGGYWATERPPDGDGSGMTMLIGEGVATVLSAKEATGHIGVAALSSGNLAAVATAMRERYPAAVLVILADLVKATGEPDAHAIDAALAVGGKLAVPDFGGNRDPGASDFNDMAVASGPEAVERAIAHSSEPVRGERHPDEKNAAAGVYGREVTLLRASDVTPEAVSWLWNGWLAAGKIHVLGGAPGTGKTTIAMALAATVTTGGRWPDGTRSTTGNAVIWSGEDDPADTLIPRLALAGADLVRVYFIDDIRVGGERRSFDPATDMEPLRRKLTEIGDVRLLIVDPLVSAIAGDSHKNAEVRRGLQPLADLAASMRCAVVGVTHFSKNTGGREPVERLTGSLAFGALARVVMVAAKCQEEGDDGRTTRLFCRAKSNNGPDHGGFHYDLHQAEIKSHPGIVASAVLWGEAVEGAARELLATAEEAGDDGEGGTLADAKRFLIGLLEDGPMRAGDVFKDADQAGYSKRSIQRAANALRVDRRKDGMRGGWSWRLSPKMPNRSEDAEDARHKFLAPLAPSASSSRVEVEI